MKLIILCLILSSCSLVQLSPTMNCEHIVYERNGNTAELLASGCKV